VGKIAVLLTASTAGRVTAFSFDVASGYHETLNCHCSANRRTGWERGTVRASKTLSHTDESLYCAFLADAFSQGNEDGSKLLRPAEIMGLKDVT
jgi:hypothetical protein